MTEISWWPGLVALALGLGGGLALAWRLAARGSRKGKARSDRADLELRRADLVARRDEIYARLKGEDGDLSTAGERDVLEMQAARVLRDLEELDAALAHAGGRSRTKKGESGSRGRAGRDSGPPAATARQGSFSSRHPLVSGFLLGAGMVAVIGVLVFWAIRDEAPTGAAPVAAGGEDPHPEIGSLPPAVGAELAELQRRLEQSPGDLGARKQLALLLLTHEQYFAAFQEAQTLLAADPDDIDGHFVAAVVRLQIGQAEAALSSFDRVLELYPDHVQALAWRGVIFYQRGEVSAAIESWESGIAAAGGQHFELEQMVSAALAEEAGIVPPAQPTVDPVPEPLSAAGSTNGGFPLRIALAADEAAPAGAVLFVALRAAEGAPPVAVRRIAAPGFPLDLVLSSADSMMGGELPEAGIVTARLDGDGDLATSTADDLSGEAAATRGEAVALTLSR